MKILKLLAKVGLVAGLFYLLARKGFISIEDTEKAFSHLELIIPAFLIAVTGAVISAFRWQLLLRAQNIRLPLARTFELCFVGNFFNIALPGAVSGDVIKAFYIAKEVGGQKTTALGSILFDRLCGLSALILVSAIAMALGIQSVIGTPLFSAIRLMVTLGAVAVVIFYGYLFFVREKHDPFLIFLRSLSKRAPRFDAITRIYLALRHYHNHRGAVLQALGLSVVTQFAICFSSLLFLRALGETSIDPIALFIVTPLGLLATAVPVMPAGIGTGHAAFGWLFHFLGTQRGADVFSLFALTQILVGAIGGIVYLRFKSQNPDQPKT